jgi:hypothetical protein
MGEEERISTEELYKTHLGISATEQTTVHHQRLKRAMQRLGWQGPRFMWVGTSQKRGYFRTKRPAVEKF